jgi:Ser/Thr protein kinase RdoA (MazF antagonist)
MQVDPGSLEVGPDEFLAAAIVEAALGGGVSQVRHRPTRRHAYIFDVTLTDGRRAIARLALPEARDALRHAVDWSERLRLQNLPLPQILACDVASEFPYMVVERLPGTTLGAAIRRLSAASLGLLAGSMADLQATIARLPSSGRYGEATSPEDALSLSWSDAVITWLREARQRIAQADLMPAEAVDRIAACLPRLRERLDMVPATPFILDDALSDVIVSARGELSGIVDLGPFCWGDPRVAPAFTLAAAVKAGHPTGFAEAWLALGGGQADALYWLYAATGTVRLMAEYGHNEGGTSRAFKKADRTRLDAMLDGFLDRLARAA